MEERLEFVLPKSLCEYITCQNKIVIIITQISLQNGDTGRLTQKGHHCVMGCNDAISKYYQQLKLHMKIPPAPALVADSLMATSLKLEWNFPEARKDGLSCHVQWKYEEVDRWQFCGNATWDSTNTIVSINNLKPYTKYRVSAGT